MTFFFRPALDVLLGMAATESETFRMVDPFDVCEQSPVSSASTSYSCGHTKTDEQGEQCNTATCIVELNQDIGQILDAGKIGARHQSRAHLLASNKTQLKIMLEIRCSTSAISAFLW